MVPSRRSLCAGIVHGALHWLRVCDAICVARAREQMKSTLVLLAAMLASASAFAPAAVGMPKAPALRSTKPAATSVKMAGDFEITDNTPFKLSIAPVGAFGFAGWVSLKWCNGRNAIGAESNSTKENGGHRGSALVCRNGHWPVVLVMTFLVWAGRPHHPHPLQHPALRRQGATPSLRKPPDVCEEAMRHRIHPAPQSCSALSVNPPRSVHAACGGWPSRGLLISCLGIDKVASPGGALVKGGVCA
jgi:hypothetical protein